LSGVIEFRVVSRSKTETAEGTKFRVKLKSAEGHVLTLISTSQEIFVGYPIGEKIPVDIRKARTLQKEA